MIPNITDTILSATNFAFNNMKLQSEQNRLTEYAKFASIYEQDSETVIKITKAFYLDRPFSEETLTRIPFIYEDIVEKVISRKTSGLISKQPSIELVKETGDTKELFDIEPFLDETNLFEVIQDAIQKAEYYNTVILQPVERDGKINIDVITPDECSVIPAKDYLKIKEIAVGRVDENQEIYASYWTETEHYKKLADGRNVPVEGNEDGVNPYGELPFIVFRVKAGKDFWGEPNWSVYYRQLSYIMSINDTSFGEFFQKFPLLKGVNYDLGTKVKYSPGELLNVNNQNSNQAPPTLDTIAFNTPWNDIRENEKFRMEQFYVNQGLPASSFATDKTAQSGSAKEMDEKELEESRDRKRTAILKMVKDLLRISSIVWNYHKDADKLPEDGFTFAVQLNDQNIMKSAQEIQSERDMQKGYGIKDEIDFIMEDLELTEDQAIEHYKKRRERMALIESGQTKPVNKVLSILDVINQNIPAVQ